MRFHLIDRIDDYEAGKSVRGRKLTSAGEEIWDESPGGPVMSPPLVLESLCQAATWLIVASTGRRKRAALLQLGSVRFDGDVVPGDVLELSGEIETMSAEMAVLSGTAAVGDRSVLRADDIMCALIDADDLEGAPETEVMLRRLTREAS
ncbi:hypothetical protein [Actinomadura sp. 9N215]|uniref:hypothetical protein n=1 Tax=Actinomadura sp. 9N215 TaxID=3375150 RepID=UPI0037B7B151